MAVPESAILGGMSIDLSTVDIPKEPAHRRVWIIAMLRLRGTSLRQIAKDLKVSPQAVSNALLVPSRFIEKAVADALGISVEALFFERFDGAGNRLTRTRETQRSTAGSGRNGKGREAA